MTSLGPKQLDICQIYARYLDIISQKDQPTARESLSMFLHSIQSEGLARDPATLDLWSRVTAVCLKGVQPVDARNVILSDLVKLMSSLNLSVDSHRFSCFYDFVFFISCEDGQKNISVNRAVTAWRVVLAGRFRLLNQWCSFVEGHQRHNISVDTWQQVLAFSRCVNEDLDGYDPKGAWPVLVDDFVEHMYRINQHNSCSTEFNCSCSNERAEPGISSTFRVNAGLNLLPGSKRKLFPDNEECCSEFDGSLINKSKRLRHGLALARRGCWDSNIIVEDSLVKGFEGHLLIGCCFQLEHSGSYT